MYALARSGRALGGGWLGLEEGLVSFSPIGRVALVGRGRVVSDLGGLIVDVLVECSLIA